VTLAAGTRLGAYEIVAPLGAGGMGEVYRAHDPRLGRDVALKVLPAEVATSPDRLARLEREARTVAALNHPNIVVLHSIEQHGGTRFLTMELVEGASLAERIVPGGVAREELLDLAIALADALGAAHARGVVHRDLKPANVMVTREGRVKVLDFGLAKAAAAPSGVAHTQAATRTRPISEVGQVMGTVPYMAPEQLRGDAVDARTDLFALGILVYELATGRRPFEGDSAADITSAVLRDAPPALATRRGDLPDALDRLVARCLEKRPEDRPGSALELRDALRAVRRDLERGGPAPAAASRREAVASIAVLPFANRSADPDDAYFSDGLADELLNVLSKIRGFRVAARSSAFSFKDRHATAEEIGRALRVDTLLDGSVRKSGTRARISVQLVTVADGYQLWSETYDRTLDDLFAVQDDIAQSVVKALRATLFGEPDPGGSGAVHAEVSQAARNRRADPEAHRDYLQARHLMARSTREDTERAVALLHRSLARDPGFALAWAELSAIHVWQVDLEWTSMAEGTLRARQAAERAVALQPDLAEGYVALAALQMNYDWNWAGAEASLRRALELAPHNAVVLRRAGVLNDFLCRHEQAIALYRRAIALDPLSASAYNNLGIALHIAGRLDEAEAACRTALELAPQRAGTRSILSMILLALGRADEALAEAAREPNGPFQLEALARVHFALGHRAEADAALEQMIAEHAVGSAYQIAEAFGARGDVDAAFTWLERAWAQRDAGLPDLRSSVSLRGLHADPRWAPLVRRVGFEV
jgi:serine/threonine protein kinase/Flp pilus assembly protein TadD